MKQHRRILSLALALVLCLGLLPTAALAAEEYIVTEVVPCKYETIPGIGVADFSEGFAAVMRGGKLGFVDQTGKEVVPCKYEHIAFGLPQFSEGLAAVALNGKWGYIDKTGKEVIPHKYDGAYVFTEGLAAVKLSGKWGYIDKTGQEVIHFKYDSAGSFTEGLARVKLDGKWGFIDETGKEVVPCKYDAAKDFSDGLAAVRQDGKWGYISISGPAPEENMPPVEVEPEANTALTIGDTPDGTTLTESPTESPTEPPEPTQPTETTDPNGPVVFTDVPADAWYAEAVNALAEGGLVKGVGDGKFNPDGEVTYGELVAILARLYCPADAPLNVNYNPVPDGNNRGYLGWHYAYGWRIVSVRRMRDTREDIKNGTNAPAAHWAALYNDSVTTRVMEIVETEDLDVPVIRGSAIEHIACAALHAKAGAPEYVNAYTPADIPDWNDVLGIEHKVSDAYSDETADIHVWPIDDELHFLPNDYVCYDFNYEKCPGYNMDSVAANDLNGQTWVKAHPDLVLRAYNMGITEGVDETHACDVYGRLTRAELCAMLYRTGLTKPGSCNWPEQANFYDGKHAKAHDAPYWK